MEKDFSELINRDDSKAGNRWSIGHNVIPLTIYDNYFLINPNVNHDIIKSIMRGKHLYSIDYLKDSFYDAYYSLYNRLFEMEFTKDEIFYISNVHRALPIAINGLTEPKDYVVYCSPTNPDFPNMILESKRIPVDIPLINHNGKYLINFDSLEIAFANRKTKLFVISNPNFPIGKIFSIYELNRIGRLAKKHNVKIFSYESHNLISRPGIRYVPFVKANDFNKDLCITYISPSKAIHLLSLSSAAVIISNPEINKLYKEKLGPMKEETDAIPMVASISALNKGLQKIFELNDYLFKNKDYIANYIEKNIPLVSVVKTDATYSVWIDISKLETSSDKFAEYLFKAEKVLVQSGSIYGSSGDGYVRMNAATRIGNIQLALERFRDGVIHFYEFNNVKAKKMRARIEQAQKREGLI